MRPPVKVVTRSGESFSISEGTGPLVAFEVYAFGRTVTLFLTPGETEAIGTALLLHGDTARSKVGAKVGVR